MKKQLYIFLLFFPIGAWAQNISGRVVDKETEMPLSFVQIWIPELNRSVQSEENGIFFITQIPLENITLQATRIGYTPLHYPLTVLRDTLFIVLKLTESHTQLQEITLVGSQDAASVAIALRGADLRTNLGTTLAETLNDEAGMSMRSMGAAPARPVLRGLGGDRLQVLESGNKTGDLSATSADHALAIDPINAQNLVVLRGAEALKHGSGNIGGVIDVVRDYVPNHLPEDLHFEGSLQGESASWGRVLGAKIGNPLGKNGALHLDLSYRRAENLRSPTQKLENTNLQIWNTSLGTAKIYENGYFGGAFSHYNSQYGIPGGFIGGHPNGVDIRMYRNYVEAKWHHLPKNKRLKVLDVNSVFTYLFQQEFESADYIGVEFGVGTWQNKAQLQFESSFLNRLEVGVQHEYRNYEIGGLYFSPDSKEHSLGTYFLGQKNFDKLKLTGLIRGDWRGIYPYPEDLDSRIGAIVKRRFGGISGGITAFYPITNALETGFHFLKTTRMPSVEELFSEGPHLAAYSFDTGAPSLKKEQGIGLEWVNLLRGDEGEAAVSLFYNSFKNYIFLEDTGRINYRTLLPIYQYKGENAQLYGIEGSVEGHFLERFTLKVTSSFVNGKTEDKKYLPQMPPFHGNVRLKYEQNGWGIFVKSRFASSQNRLSTFEATTPKYNVYDIGLQYHVTHKHKLHTLDFGIENVLDTTYRDHLSRIKSVMPESGINIKFLYKIFI